MTTRSTQRLLWGMLGAYVGACALAWPHLPERMPLHFGLAGGVTSWTETSAMLWFLPPALCTGLVLLILAAAGPPEAWRLAQEDLKRFRALPADRQRRIRDSVRRSTLLSLVCVVVLFLGLQLSLYVTAVREAQRMPASAYILLIGPVLLLLLLGRRDRSRLPREIRSAADDPGSGCSA